jgi:ankyrin repeat protein
LIVKYPQHVNDFGGYYVTPAVAALAGRYFQLAQLLHRNGSSVDPRGFADETPLHSAAYYGDLEMVQVLLDYGVDVNVQARAGSTPLNFGMIGRLNDPRVVRLLLDHGADPNTGGGRFNSIASSITRGQDQGNSPANQVWCVCRGAG